ncbi:MAG TPA: hypothetical protein VGM73_14125 [Candidatus Didemnitutus sp.]
MHFKKTGKVWNARVDESFRALGGWLAGQATAALICAINRLVAVIPPGEFLWVGQRLGEF